MDLLRYRGYLKYIFLICTFFKNIYFIYFLAASGLSCCTWALRCSTWAFLQLWRAGSRASELCSCGAQALSLRHSSSVVVACELSCPAACGILVPRPGIEPTSPALEGRFFTTGPAGKSLDIFKNLFYFPLCDWEEKSQESAKIL